MELDFSYGVYERLIDTALENGYRVLTVRDYVSSDALPERFLILRHDVDRKPENALEMARIEAEANVSATYYFRTIDKTYEPDLIAAVEDLGHEVGYHYEDLDMADGDLGEACDSFAAHLEQFREFADIDTVSMHGNPLTPHDNRDVWGEMSLDDHDLLGEVYLSVDFSDVVYFSDSNRTWYDEKTIVNDWPIGPSMKPVQVRSTPDLIRLIASREIPRIYLLAHPNRWAGSMGEWVREFSKDVLTNIGKWGLYHVRSLRGTNQTPASND